MNDFDQELALAGFRFAMGINIVTHGAVRIFGDLTGFVQNTAQGFSDTFLPLGLVQAFALTLPFLELILGTLLVLGLWTRWTLFALILFMASLMFGMSLRQEWQTVGSQVVYALAFFLLLFWNRPNRFSLDGQMARRRA